MARWTEGQPERLPCRWCGKPSQGMAVDTMTGKNVPVCGPDCSLEGVAGGLISQTTILLAVRQWLDEVADGRMTRERFAGAAGMSVEEVEELMKEQGM